MHVNNKKAIGGKSAKRMRTLNKQQRESENGRNKGNERKNGNKCVIFCMFGTFYNVLINNMMIFSYQFWLEFDSMNYAHLLQERRLSRLSSAQQK